MAFMDPKETLAHLALRDGMKVGDFGAGVGHYAIPAAIAVGESGKVYAFDIQQDVVTRLVADATQRGFTQLSAGCCDFEQLQATKLKDDTLDAAILSNALFQLEDKEGALKEIFRVLKPSGKLLVVDWSGPHGGMGPIDEHVITESEALRLLEGVGFSKLKSFDPGDHHYAIIVTKPA